MSIYNILVPHFFLSLSWFTECVNWGMCCIIPYLSISILLMYLIRVLDYYRYCINISWFTECVNWEFWTIIGPFLVTDIHNNTSTVTIDIPAAPNVFPTFHSSLVKHFVQNNNSKFPCHTLEKPGPINMNGQEEFFVDHIMDHKKIGHSFWYLVCWCGEAPGEDCWIKGADLDKNEALDAYWNGCSSS